MAIPIATAKIPISLKTFISPPPCLDELSDILAGSVFKILTKRTYYSKGIDSKNEYKRGEHFINEPCLMVFAHNALAFRPGTGRNSIGFTTICRKVEVGKQQGIVAFPGNPGKILNKGR
jgi:hypothetical protein